MHVNGGGLKHDRIEGSATQRTCYKFHLFSLLRGYHYN